MTLSYIMIISCISLTQPTQPPAHPLTHRPHGLFSPAARPEAARTTTTWHRPQRGRVAADFAFRAESLGAGHARREQGTAPGMGKVGGNSS